MAKKIRLAQIEFNGTSTQFVKADGSFDSNSYATQSWVTSNLADYYTKTQLQTSGQASVNWGNLTNVPATFPATAHNHDDRYHLKSESVPYTGATANVNLGPNNQIKAKEFDAIGTYVEKPNTNRNYEFLKLNGSTISVYQPLVS